MIIPIQSWAFYFFAILLIAAALMTIISRNPVRCALFLVLAFFSAAALWILLEAEFLGLILVLVYVGAVMTLFLFVIMTLNIDDAKKQYGFVRYVFFAVISVLILLALLIYTVFPLSGTAGLLPLSAQASNTQALGDVLYTQYVYPFEITGVLLLVGIIATIALSFREKRLNKAIAPELQLKVKPSDRLRIIKMPAERKK
ncbi:MAG: NADH-quinone oxidoreductase subunit J [Candidatus Rickettsiella isopodorum]|jgi:NADH-quinone oxidoreductase subunit J|nr:NADH-quinone oxidoreductase subunit J [Gammaproteobacteria bacterium]MCH9755487.1 NADH-quinone oxidoreductase subunit J [Gammaproteobacteria bacterium]MDD4893364.1 NADH-quinone oxidoreductase subunit J [Candidatus Rickettsiella isopodorum]MDD5161961.1 NADH-quinone oxidoreductase subunit J [Candidatus Rickettsiella isopodorum]MDQ5900408.1 NADH-quinone oxidoreductase subunit [Pseudomonadota bacterium]